MAEGTTNSCHQKHVWDPCSVFSSLSAELSSRLKTAKEALHPETGYYVCLFFFSGKKNEKLDRLIEF